MITTGQVSALGTPRPTLTLLTPSQLLDASVQFFDLSAHVVRVLSDLRGHRLIQVISNNPVNVAVRGDYLEQPYLKRHFFQLNQEAVFQSVRRSLQFVQVDIARCLTQTHLAIALQCGEERPMLPVNYLQILAGRIPSIEQYRPGFQPLILNGLEKHLPKVTVFALVINLRRIHTIVYRIEIAIFTIATLRDQIDNPNSFDQPVFCSAILGLHQFYKPRVAFILNTVIYDQECFRTVFDPALYQLPQLPWTQLLLPQKVVDHIVAHPFQMLGQIGAGVANRSAQQILDIFFLAYHALMVSYLRLKRKS